MRDSQKSFSKYYDLYTNKIKKTENTIFEDVDLSNQSDKMYQLFSESDIFYEYLDATDYSKLELVKTFLENTLLQTVFDETLESLEESGVTFTQQWLLENTQETFNLTTASDGDITSEQAIEIIEEGYIYDKIAQIAVGSAAAGALFGGIIPAAAGGVVVGALSLLMPAKYGKKGADMVGSVFGSMALSIVGLNGFNKPGNGVKKSQLNMAELDNIHLNPEVQKMFKQLNAQHTIDGKSTVKILDNMVGTCIRDNKEISDMDSGKSWLKEMFKGTSGPNSSNVFKELSKQLLKEGGSKNDDGFGTLLKFRKCLIEKLLDVYKYLMMSTLSNTKNSKKILKSIEDGFHQKPEQLLNFVDSRDDEEIKDLLSTLVNLRQFFNQMEQDYKGGFLDVDKESALFLKQKIKTVDKEVEQYLSTHSRSLGTVYENRKQFDRDELLSSKPTVEDSKQKLLNF